MIEIVIFWICFILLTYSYVFFPALISILARRKKINQQCFAETDILPTVSIIISVYNEEKVIEQRVKNLFYSQYPADKIEVWIGSDGSTDRTGKILKTLQTAYPQLNVMYFAQRRGKGNVLNDLCSKASGEIFVFTDAKVLFSPKTIFHLVKHFKNPSIGLVGGNIVSKNTRNDGISVQETAFMSREIMIKYHEGKYWGTSMGAYGACFAMPGKLYSAIPPDFAVDDFFQTMMVLRQKHQCIMELNALCYEDVPNKIEEEFRRKVRISCGNYQNVNYFKGGLLKINAINFCFFSHKLIRWYGPFLLVGAFLACGLAALHSYFYLAAFFAQIFLLIIPVIDFFLHKNHIQIIILRFITHFYSMNLALLFGFIKYMKGNKTNVWEPTERRYM